MCIKIMKFESTKFLLDHVENVFESEVFKCSSTDVTMKTHIFHIQYTAKSSLLTNNNIVIVLYYHIIVTCTYRSPHIT